MADSRCQPVDDPCQPDGGIGRNVRFVGVSGKSGFEAIARNSEPPFMMMASVRYS